jgi:hypothetical protein
MRRVLTAFASLALLAGCARMGAPAEGSATAEVTGTAPAPAGAGRGQQQLTAAAHALFVDVCVRYLGRVEPLRRRAEERNLVLIQEDIRPQSAPSESVRLYGIRASDGGVIIGMMVNANADSCAVAIMRPETSLALALASQMALVWTEGGSRVTPVAPPGRADIGARIFFRVQSSGDAARRPAPDWIFGVTVATDGSGLFQAILAPRSRPGPRSPDPSEDAPLPVPRGILRSASFTR